MNDSFDPWRQDVSQSLGEIKANIQFLVKSRETDDVRIKALEEKQSKRDGILGLVVLVLPILPFLADIKKFFTG